MVFECHSKRRKVSSRLSAVSLLGQVRQGRLRVSSCPFLRFEYHFDRERGSMFSEEVWREIRTMTFRMEKRWSCRAAPALVLLSLLCGSLTSTCVVGQSAVKGGYYTGGTSSLFPSSGLDATLYTHLFYAFASWSNTTDEVTAPSGNLGEMETFSANMKKKNPDVLTLISISVTGDEFAPVLGSAATQEKFINSSISLARSLNFDGLDLDWEFAKSQEEMDEFGSFIEKWRQAVVAEGNENTSRTPLLLTAAVYFNATLDNVGQGSYPIQAITDNLDFINIMTYDYHGTWDVTQTGACTNLYDNSSVLSTDHGITSWLESGIPPNKAVMGLTLYGRSWTLKNETIENGLGAAAIAAGPPQPISKSPGVLYYSEVVSFINNYSATVVHNMDEVTGYCYANNVWVSYEDRYIISKKVVYTKSRGLRGYFFWEVSQDNNFEVSKAASQTSDTGKYSSGASAASSSVYLVAVGMVLSVLLLLRWSTLDLVR